MPTIGTCVRTIEGTKIFDGTRIAVSTRSIDKTSADIYTCTRHALALLISNASWAIMYKNVNAFCTAGLLIDCIASTAVNGIA